MGYIIEVSINVFKTSSVSELEHKVFSLAEEYGCQNYHEIYEMETGLNIQRNHCVISLNFEESNITQMLKFIKKIKTISGLYIESIYNENVRDILYASQYYLTIMDKYKSKDYKINRRKRSYSEDDTLIMNEVDKSLKNQRTIKSI